MKKAWDTKPLCKVCKQVRTKGIICSYCMGKASVRKAVKQGFIPKHKPKTKSPEPTKAQEKAYVEAAQRVHTDEGTCEIDDGAEVSWAPGNGGCYVQAWVWVSDDD